MTTQNVALYCPKLPNEKHPKSLLIFDNVGHAAHAAQREKNNETQLTTAWQRLKNTNNRALNAQPAFIQLSQATSEEIICFFERTIVQSPNELQLTTPAEAIEWLTFQYQQHNRFPEKVYAVGFKRVWQSIVRSFLQGSEVVFAKDTQALPENAAVVTWGQKELQLPKGAQLVRLEDGFLRSVGLGAQFAKPLSWVADTKGMYFDATGESDLEFRLNTNQYSNEDKKRAKSLINQINSNGVNKYNTGHKSWQRPDTAKKVILVTGQVESDASIRFGAINTKSNLDLVSKVRVANPEAYIVYKPHPDVVSGARKKGAQENQALNHCDEQITDVNISTLIAQVDEVHVMTSLAGFEALLQNKTVVCYGMPFYAGWGLTQDHETNTRRNRALTIEELVYGALIEYPLYISRSTGYYCRAEDTLQELINWREQKPTLANYLKSQLKKMARKATNFALGAK